MSDWCKCGHGSGWHTPKYDTPSREGCGEWACRFQYNPYPDPFCRCEKFDDRHPDYDSCETCGHPYYDWMGTPHDDSIHSLHCPCKKFKWRSSDKPDPNVKRVIEI